MKVKIIGIGAAGNKAAIALIEQGVVNEDNILLLNSTLRDVPKQYGKLAKQLTTNTNGSGGCGKERDLAKDLMLKSLQEETISLDGFIDPDDDMAVIVSSSEGGTGCGASIILAEYITEVLGINVSMFVFTGFEEDVRGLANTVAYFQDLKSNYVVQAISNRKFLDETGNKLRAEREANNAFVNKIRTIIGSDLVECSQNIDETDLKKIVLTPGFMIVESSIINSKIKNINMFNDLCSNLIDKSSSLEFNPSAKRIGVILNISEKTKDYIDYTFQVLKNKLGSPFELYTHIQTDGEIEYISVIASGINLPLEDIQSVYNKYMQESAKVQKKKDSFFNKSKDFVKSEEDSIFDSAVKEKRHSFSNSKCSFFSSRMNKNNTANIGVSKPVTQEKASTIQVLKEADIKTI